MLTSDIDPRFDKAFLAACNMIGCKPLDLLGLMMSESGVRPYAHNAGPPGAPEEKRYNAVGLIQFMPATLQGLHWYRGYEDFKHLSASDQLPYVVAFFEPWRKAAGGWDSASRLYQACFLPATLTTCRKPGDVLAARGGPLGWAFEANAGFDANGNGAIALEELGAAIVRAQRGPRWVELVKRLGLEEGALTVIMNELAAAIAAGAPALDEFLRSPLGIQEALVKLGFDVGPYGVDGSIGKDTRAAIAALQAKYKIHVDGIAGKETRGVMVRELLKAPAVAAELVVEPAPDTAPAPPSAPQKQARKGR